MTTTGKRYEISLYLCLVGYTKTNMRFNFAHLRRYVTIQNGALALALLITLSWVVSTVVTLKNNFMYQQQVDQSNQQVQVLQLKNQNLKYQQAYLKSDEFLELSARDRLGKAAPGEHLVILPSSDKIIDKQTAAPTASREQASDFAQWMQFFFGHKQG
jgi:cell division protein FtsB